MATATTANAPAFISYHARAIRVTAVDNCGVPLTGVDAQCASEGVISVELKANTDKGTDIDIKNGLGLIIKHIPGKPTTKGYDLTLTMTGVDPSIWGFITGNPAILDKAGNNIGGSVNMTPDGIGGFALETWGDGAFDDMDACALGYSPSTYFLVPFFNFGLPGDWKIDSGAMAATLTASSEQKSGWDVGPYQVMNSATDNTVTPVPSPLLTPIGAKELLRYFVTPIPAPDPTNGAAPIPTA